MTLALYMNYNRLSDRGPFELRIEVYILLLSRTNLRKTEGASMGSMVFAVIANLHKESYRSNRYPISEGSGNAMYMTQARARGLQDSQRVRHSLHQRNRQTYASKVKRVIWQIEKRHAKTKASAVSEETWKPPALE